MARNEPTSTLLKLASSKALTTASRVKGQNVARSKTPAAIIHQEPIWRSLSVVLGYGPFESRGLHHRAYRKARIGGTKWARSYLQCIIKTFAHTVTKQAACSGREAGGSSIARGRATQKVKARFSAVIGRAVCSSKNILAVHRGA